MKSTAAKVWTGKSDYYLSVIPAQAGIQKNNRFLVPQEQGFPMQKFGREKDII